MKRYKQADWKFWALVCFVCLAMQSPALGLDVATTFVHADDLWNLGYTGVGVEIGIIDLFLADASHPALAGNYLGSEKFAKGPNVISSHATSVAGAAVSQDATYPGSAPGAGWWTAQTTMRGGKTTIRDQTTAAETFARGLESLSGNPVEVITLSIGIAGSTSGMDQWSLGLDHVVNTNGVTVTVAAGNDGPVSGTISGLPSGAYNVITVGATGDTFGLYSDDYTNVAIYSSRGPMVDGRTKPDLIAPGSSIYMPTLNGGWAESHGTSFATPLVAGGAALLVGVGRDMGYATDPKLIKSVLMNSATKLAGWSNSPTQPLDFNQGAGQMHLLRAYHQYASGPQNPGVVPVPEAGWDLQTVTDANENLYMLDPEILAGGLISITLNWDRIVTASSDNPDNAIYSEDHLSNLDLVLYHTDDLTTPVANSVSDVDNVEHLYYTFDQPGQYAIGVRLSDATPGDEEDYALTWDILRRSIIGDANLNGYVDGADLGMLLARWKSSTPDGLIADFNGDYIVDGADLGMLLARWKDGTPPAASPAPIPEPATILLVTLGGLAIMKRRRGR